jgi:hypothetical protein
LRNTRGELRICGASKSVEAMLRGLGFNHLVRCDPTVEVSVIALSARMIPKASRRLTLVGTPHLDAPGPTRKLAGPELIAVPARITSTARAG